ncbi:TPA: DUF550 domain-containing protein [Klebsiella pneumoniae]|nr:DUF550 domain-containing protein [Klebsiella pneumoniae]HBW4512354.1 DUF550 domain-containing protein [Klebsiella pneumoniae]HBW4517511.1 DUF550 domain-containing protein [Klebsiella pneumoniae]HBW4562782.1 DUF550 domain-containing protein [Klebsiella pneumoniae]HBW4606473.1 DUF550 domain-containing protein [Klebsiella pneumoniae]
MTNNQLTDERVTSVIERLEHYACNLKWTNVRGAQDLLAAADGLRELQERRKAAMDSEPVAWTWHYREQWLVTNDKCRAEFVAKDGDVAVLPLYRHAQPAPERDQVRIAHAEWSQATFGNVGPVGPLKHLSKEALEAAAEPGDLSEWADMQFLLWDAQRRAGITDEQITQAMIEKLAVNKQRSWPEPKDGEPRLHINEQPALTGNFPIIGIDLATGPDRTVEVSYVAPPGYVMVPMRLTAENGAKGALSGEFSETKFVNCSECFGDDECETCDGSGRIEITVPVSWTTIKEIWAKGVEHFAAAPQEVK